MNFEEIYDIIEDKIGGYFDRIFECIDVKRRFCKVIDYQFKLYLFNKNKSNKLSFFNKDMRLKLRSNDYLTFKDEKNEKILLECFELLNKKYSSNSDWNEFYNNRNKIIKDIIEIY